jgi:hypothetical protein
MTPLKEEKPAIVHVEDEIKSVFAKDETHNEHRRSKGKPRK